MQVEEDSQASKEPVPLGVIEGLWEIFISKKLRKMLKKLGELASIKWWRAQDSNKKPKKKVKKNMEVKNKKRKQKQMEPIELHHKN